MLIKVRSKETEAVVAALSQQVRKLPAALKRSLTWDRGLEMAKHKDFTVATDVQVYFLRSAKPLATRHERKHQSAVTAHTSHEAPDLSELFSRAARPGLAALESGTTEKDPWIPNTCR